MRCQIPDVPGGLATLAGAIAEGGGDIHAVEVVQADADMVIDDLWIETHDVPSMRSHIEALEDTRIIHTAPSRGMPGDATTRLAAGIDAVLSGAMSPADALPTLIGGLLRADTAEMTNLSNRFEKRNRKILRLDVTQGVLMLTRDYRFLDAEIQRARQVLTVCERAWSIAAHISSRR